MAGFVVLWPKATVQVKGKRTVLSKGDEIPDGVEDTDVATLVILGAVASLGGSSDSVDDAPSPGSVKAVLADVGDDPALAQVALDEENAKDEPRPSLVKKLEAIISAGTGS